MPHRAPAEDVSIMRPTQRKTAKITLSDCLACRYSGWQLPSNCIAASSRRVWCAHQWLRDFCGDGTHQAAVGRRTRASNGGQGAHGAAAAVCCALSHATVGVVSRYLTWQWPRCHHKPWRPSPTTSRLARRRPSAHWRRSSSRTWGSMQSWIQSTLRMWLSSRCGCSPCTNADGG